MVGRKRSVSAAVLDDTLLVKRRRWESFFEARAGAVDVKACGHDACGSYFHLHAFEIDSTRRPSADYIDTIQTEITADMRAILVDWLVDVAEEYRLMSETLFLTVSCLDRFLSRNTVGRKKLQLLGVASMLAASKHEEICPLAPDDLSDITDDTYRKEEVLEMEIAIQKSLNFEIVYPSIKTFLRIFHRAAVEEGTYPSILLEILADYLSEMSLIDYECLQFPPSKVAASALFLARFTIDPTRHAWSNLLQRSTGYRAWRLRVCVKTLHDLQLNWSSYSSAAIRQKYQHPKMRKVSLLQSPAVIPECYFED